MPWRPRRGSRLSRTLALDEGGWLTPRPGYVYTRWFKYDRDKLWLVYKQSVPPLSTTWCRAWTNEQSVCYRFIRRSLRRNEWYKMYKVVQIWPGLFVCKPVTVSPGHIWTLFLCVCIYIYIYICKVVQIWPGLFVCKQVTVCPGHIWTTLYILYVRLYTQSTCYKLWLLNNNTERADSAFQPWSPKYCIAATSKITCQTTLCCVE
jgi:hypothetical protein